jgi:hypothetical protein
MAVILMCRAVAPASKPDDITCSERVIEQSWALLGKARYGYSALERAAFIVRDDGGVLSFVEWPWSAQPWHAQYGGRIPHRTVAIVHTHLNAHPLPSSVDVALAQRISLPVYVLTRGKISRTVGGTVETILVGDWNPSRRPRLLCH